MESNQVVLTQYCDALNEEFTVLTKGNEKIKQEITLLRLDSI